NENIAGRNGPAGLSGDDEFCVSRLAARPPMPNSVRPPFDCFVAIATHVKLRISMGTHINEIRGEILRIRPFPRRIGKDESNIVLAQYMEKFWHHKPGMRTFQSVAHGSAVIDFSK